ncbi:MAG: hypothetical protein NZ108_11315, partial [Bacteroidia bacterium]|nr:hypothetical protein [Bacteroidia bacterium]
MDSENYMHAEINRFFEQFSPKVSEISKMLFELTAETLLSEVTVWIDHADKMITFGTEKNWNGEVCYIKPLKDSVNLGFFHGANLNDPNRLL